MTKSTAITVYFDYMCPFAFRGVRLLTEIEQTRPDISVAWRHFSLEQVNAISRGKDPEWKVWEQPLDYKGIYRKSRGRLLRPFLASHAASLQGVEPFARFRLALFGAFHDDWLDTSDPEVLLDVARQVDLDMDAFQANWQSQEGRDRLRDDHLSGEEAGVFGVPTLIINNCEATYMRLSEYPPAEEMQTFFDELLHSLCHRPYLQELKRAGAA